MTDKDIIKALECCSTRSGEACSECPYHQYYDRCITKRNADITDLINRQKAEIERLQSHIFQREKATPKTTPVKANSTDDFMNKLKSMYDKDDE